jgi:hypothetical protein
MTGSRDLKLEELARYIRGEGSEVAANDQDNAAFDAFVEALERLSPVEIDCLIEATGGRLNEANNAADALPGMICAKANSNSRTQPNRRVEEQPVVVRGARRTVIVRLEEDSATRPFWAMHKKHSNVFASAAYGRFSLAREVAKGALNATLHRVIFHKDAADHLNGFKIELNAAASPASIWSKRFSSIVEKLAGGPGKDGNCLGSGADQHPSPNGSPLMTDAMLCLIKQRQQQLLDDAE